MSFRPSIRTLQLRGTLAVALSVLAPVAAHGQAVAGTAIPNTAYAEIDGEGTRLASNTAVLRIAELLDIGLSAPSQRLTLTAGVRTAVPFTLVNRGNGQEAFQLTGSLSAGLVELFAIDRDGDGRYDPLRDTMLDRSATPVLAPGGSLSLIAVVRSEEPAATDELVVIARSVTASGTPGKTADGLGDGGVDAIVGDTTATATLRFTTTPGQGGGGDGGIPEAILEKSQSFLARNGSDRPLRGATITYSLTARFNGREVARAASIADLVPAGTSYVPGSLTLDSQPLSDAADADAGVFDGAGIQVVLGDVAGATVHIIQFKVIIQ